MDNTKGLLDGKDLIPKNNLMEQIDKMKLERLSKKENGSKVAAFFDFDKTLIEGDSQHLESLSLLSKPCIWPNVCFFFRTVRTGVIDLLSSSSHSNKDEEEDAEKKFRKLYDASISGYKGFPISILEEHATTLYQEDLKPKLYQQMLERVEKHRQEGHLVFLISASPHHLLEPFCQDVSFDDWIGTSLETESNAKIDESTCTTISTGKVDAEIMFGENKVKFAQQMAEKWDIDLEHSYFYSDHHTDIPLLNAVGHPIAVNPSKKLEETSKEKKWPVLWLD